MSWKKVLRYDRYVLSPNESPLVFWIATSVHIISWSFPGWICGFHVASRTKLQMAKFRQRVEQTRRGGFPEVRRMFCFGFRMSSAMIAMFCVILCWTCWTCWTWWTCVSPKLGTKNRMLIGRTHHLNWWTTQFFDIFWYMWFGEFDLNNLNLQGVANFSEYPAPYHSNSAYDEDLAEILEAPGCAWHWHCVNLLIWRIQERHSHH